MGIWFIFNFFLLFSEFLKAYSDLSYNELNVFPSSFWTKTGSYDIVCEKFHVFDSNDSFRKQF